jgi:hypothetical protein
MRIKDMKLKTLFTLFFVIALGGSGLLTASAAEPTQASVITHKGRVDAFDLKRKELVVDDMAFVVDETTPVKTATGLPVTYRKIRTGSQVELLLLGSSVQEVRILK